MRWFWTFIALLALLTLGLYLARVRRASAIQLAQAQALAQDEQASTARRARAERSRTQPGDDKRDPAVQSEGSQDQPQPVTPQVIQTQEQTQEQIQPIPEPGVQNATNEDDETPAEARAIAQASEEDSDTPPPAARPETAAQLALGTPEPPSPEVLAQADEQADDLRPTPKGEIVIDILPPEPEAQIAQAEPAKPDYELLPAGGFRVLGRGIEIRGQGTKDAPYVLSWDLLKSVQQGYKPKEGKTDLPQWLSLLDGKHIRIEGNTLVPVIATTTRELLVMQNPWDGCCIGVPPTPYDAVEVTLNHDVDFGNSAVGFGTVEGDFYLDPYVVDGWVLGLYIIEDAKYRSGEGIVFPQF